MIVGCFVLLCSGHFGLNFVDLRLDVCHFEHNKEIWGKRREVSGASGEFSRKQSPFCFCVISKNGMIRLFAQLTS